MELVDNQLASTKAVVKGGYNVGQHIAILGAGGEAFSGIAANSVVECGEVTTAVKDVVADGAILDAYPVPASTFLTVDWQLNKLTVTDKCDLVITNAIGEEVAIKVLKIAQGKQTINFDVSTLSAGAYHLRLSTSNGMSKAHSFVVMR